MMPTEKHLARGALVVLLFWALAAFLGYLTGQSDSDTYQRWALRSSVNAMYRDIIAKEFNSAFSYRSAKCKEQVPRDRYVDTMGQAYGSRGLNPNGFSFALVSYTRNEAIVNVNYDNAGIYSQMSGGARRWALESDRWVYDNCD
ncbi:hypothetical protein [Mycobacteroides immunogenum]|nr:hypothetical protein [Mycobacteroides immunogenum]